MGEGDAIISEKYQHSCNACNGYLGAVCFSTVKVVSATVPAHLKSHLQTIFLQNVCILQREFGSSVPVYRCRTLEELGTGSTKRCCWQSSWMLRYVTNKTGKPILEISDDGMLQLRVVRFWTLSISILYSIQSAIQ
jgi:hypothetical protein